MLLATHDGQWLEGVIDTKASILDVAKFSLQGELNEWQQIVRGELDAVKALIQGKIVFRGDLPVNMGKWLVEFAKVTTQVDSEFVTDPLPPRRSDEIGVEAEILYAPSGPLSIAYSIIGDGPIDLLMIPGLMSHIDYILAEPSAARFFRQLSTFSRTIMYDKRGMGLSDRDPTSNILSLQDRVADLDAVMRAAGLERAVLCGYSEGGSSALLFAATHPERVSALILISTTPRFTVAPGFPEGVPPDTVTAFFQAVKEKWGSGVGLELLAPSVAGDPHFRRWWAAFQRASATPGAMSSAIQTHLTDDVRHVLPKITAPTLILHRVNDILTPVACARYMARHITGARLVELPGSDHLFWLGDQRHMLGTIRGFLEQIPGNSPMPPGQTRRRRPKSGWESLTQAELDIARLVTEGLTNREIARRLYVSPRTVQTHLSHIFGKLAISRRSELSAEAAQRRS